MTETILNSGRDAWVDSTHPAKNYGTGYRLILKYNEAHALVWIRNPAIKGETVESATLTLTAGDASTGSRTLNCYMITSLWNDGSVDWNNKPSTSTLVDSQIIGSLAIGDTVSFDVTTALQSATNGVAYYGFEIRSTGTTRHRFWAFSSGNPPMLDVIHGAAPAQPSILTPAGGTTDRAKWIAGCNFLDFTGNTSMASMQVQIDAAADTVSPDFDSGEVATPHPSLDLSTTAYSGLGSGSTTQWRVRVKDGSGLWSPWSDWVTVKYTPQSSLTITNPSGGFVGNPTPTITATFGGTMAFWQVRIYNHTKSRILYDSGKQAAISTSTITDELPAKYQGERVLPVEDGIYWVLVRAWDGEPRVSSTGSTTFVSQWQQFTLDDDASTAPSAVTAVQVGTTPGVLISWHLAVEPDSWIIGRDGQVVATLDITDVVSLGSGNYTWTDYSARPYLPHTYKVRAVNSGQKTPPGTAAAVTPAVIDAWLVSLDGSLQVRILNDSGTDSVRNVDQATTYQGVGSRAPMRVIDALGGRTVGEVTGELWNTDGRTVYQYEADALAIKAASSDQYRWVAADDNLLVEVSNLTVTSHPDTLPINWRRLIAFGWTQVGEFEYDGRV